MRKERLLHIDIIRIVSCYFVIFNHSSSKGYTLFSTYPTGSFRFVAYLSVSVFSKMSVPEFFSLSGSGLLGQQSVAFPKELQYRITKILSSLIPFSFVYEILRATREHRYFSVKPYVIHMWGAGPEFHLWFLYGYLYYLLSLPFLRHIAQQLSGTESMYLAGASILFHGLWPMLEYLFGPSSLTLFGTEESIWFINNICICPCIGYVIEHSVYSDGIHLQHLLFVTGLALLSFALVDGLTVYQFNQEKHGRGHQELFYRRFSMLNAWCLHLWIKYLLRNWSPPKIWETMIHSVAQATFGIYLFHIMILRIPWMEVVYTALRKTRINIMIVGNMYCAIVMTIGYMLTALLSHIPLLKKAVGF